jgi:hypothetical protein
LDSIEENFTDTKNSIQTAQPVTSWRDEMIISVMTGPEFPEDTELHPDVSGLFSQHLHRPD